jgi:3-hydroxyacyl-CoA dehydrogenase
MGHGICQVAAASHIHTKVIAYEKEMRFLESGKDRITKSLTRLVESGKLTTEFANDTLGKIEFTTDMDALKDTDFIVEAIIENMDLKEDLYTKLGALCKPETIFASNTSSLSIAEMAAFSGRPDRFVGIHFFNPVQVCSRDGKFF